MNLKNLAETIVKEFPDVHDEVEDVFIEHRYQIEVYLELHEIGEFDLRDFVNILNSFDRHTARVLIKIAARAAKEMDAKIDELFGEYRYSYLDKEVEDDEGITAT